MIRQQSFVEAVIAHMETLSAEELRDIWDRLDELDGYMYTSITRNKYLDLIRIFRNTGFGQEDFIHLPGVNTVGRDHDEFYPDEESIQKLVLELFYTPVG